MKKLTPKDKTIHDQFSRYGKNAKEWINKCVLLLPKIEQNRIWEKKGFTSIYEYAAKLAGMSRCKVDDSLRIIRKIEDKSELMKVARKKGLNAIRPVATIVTQENEKFWAKKALEMSKNTLAVYVKDYKVEKKEGLENARPGTRNPQNNGLNKPNLCEKNGKNSEEKISISMKLDKEVIEALKEVKGENDWNETMKKLLKLSQNGLETEQKQIEEDEKRFQKELEQEKPEKVTNCTRYTTIKIKKFILKRSKGICEHPNCNKKGEHIHHLEPFSIKKEHDPDKMILVCQDHHKIIHLGYLDPGAAGTAGATGAAGAVGAAGAAGATGAAGTTSGTWKQIEKLPWYDIKNLINLKINQYSQ